LLIGYKTAGKIIRHVLSTFALITEAPFEWRRQLILEYKLAFLSLVMELA
jgi:hypothetical protein